MSEIVLYYQNLLPSPFSLGILCERSLKADLYYNQIVRNT